MFLLLYDCGQLTGLDRASVIGEKSDRHFAQAPEARQLHLCHRSRLRVHHAETAQSESVSKLQRNARIKSNFRVVPDKLIPLETLVRHSVVDNQWLSCTNRMGAKGNISRRLFTVEPLNGFEPLPVLIDQRDR